ncbi:hypothetical protein IW261DRAFT_1420641 [Armillaria novae-zelandiae]|uniref:Uncharacterized protein n=1 Tax=Armillaria novae-zelandiae TaxID=153914 RepID=A0AA39P565_9AGAR|nr:hypothetical protein IW261DRAFT_1420641 [Armillaria novae-zelandiae]
MSLENDGGCPRQEFYPLCQTKTGRTSQEVTKSRGDGRDQDRPPDIRHMDDIDTSEAEHDRLVEVWGMHPSARTSPVADYHFRKRRTVNHAGQSAGMAPDSAGKRVDVWMMARLFAFYFSEDSGTCYGEAIKQACSLSDQGMADILISRTLNGSGHPVNTYVYSTSGMHGHPDNLTKVLPECTNGGVSCRLYIAPHRMVSAPSRIRERRQLQCIGWTWNLMIEELA